MQLFYNPEINSSNQEFTFDKTESRYIVRVLRKKDGDTILITNGLGTLFTSKIIIANDKRCLVKITNIEAKTKPWNYYLHIVIAPTKLNDRFEWFLEKATETSRIVEPLLLIHHALSSTSNNSSSKATQSPQKPPHRSSHTGIPASSPSFKFTI